MHDDDDVEYIKNEYEFTIKYKSKNFFTRIKERYQTPIAEPLSFDEQLRQDYSELLNKITLLEQEKKEQQSQLLTEKCMFLAVLIGFRTGTARFKDVIEALENIARYTSLSLYSDTQKKLFNTIEACNLSPLIKERFKLLVEVQTQLNQLSNKKESKNKLGYEHLEMAKQVIEGTGTPTRLKQAMTNNSYDKTTTKLLNQVITLVYPLECQELLNFKKIYDPR